MVYILLSNLDNDDAELKVDPTFLGALAFEAFECVKHSGCSKFDLD